METLLAGHMIAGAAAFGAGVVFLFLELGRKGLGAYAVFSYACLLAGIIILAESVFYAVIAGAGLTGLFVLLFATYRLERGRRRKGGSNEGEDK